MEVKAAGKEGYFNLDACTLCGECFHACPEMQLPIAEAVKEIELAIKGEPRYVLDRCTSCRICNTVCPADCNPWGLVVTLRNRVYEREGISSKLGLLAPHYPPNIFSSLAGNLSYRERELVKDWERLKQGEEIFLPGILNLLYPYIYDSELIADLPVLCGAKYDAGVIYYVPGYIGPAREVYANTVRILNAAGARRVVAETETYDMLKHNVSGEKHDFEVVHILQWLQERMEEGRIKAVAPVKKMLTIHDNCMSRDFPDMMDAARNLLASMGCEVVEMENSRDKGVCCGLGGGSRSFNPVDMIAQAAVRLKEAERTGAEGLAVYCPGCLWMLSMARALCGSRLDVYHVFELVRMAAGDSSLQGNHDERSWQLLGIMGDGIASDFLFSRGRRLFYRYVPCEEVTDYSEKPQPFKVTLVSKLLSKAPVRRAVSAMGSTVTTGLLSFFLAAKRGLFSIKARYGMR